MEEVHWVSDTQSTSRSITDGAATAGMIPITDGMIPTTGVHITGATIPSITAGTHRLCSI